MKRLLSLCTLVFMAVAMFGATSTVTFDFKTLKGLEIDGTHYDVSYKNDGSVQAYEHWQPLKSVITGGVVITFGRQGSTDPAIYYNNSSGVYELRMYGSSATAYTQMTVTAPAGKVITAMSSVNTNGTTDTEGTTYTASVGTLNASKPTAVTWSCPEGTEQVTFTYRKALRYASLTVTLEDEEAVEPEPDPKYKVSLVVMEYVDGQLVPNPEAGTLTLSGTKTEFEEGEYYYVSAASSDGYCFRFILDGDGSNSKNTAISRRMGDHDVTVTAVFDRLHALKTSVWEDKKGVLNEDTSEYSSLGYINISTDKYVSNRKGYVADEVVNISAYAYSAYEFRYLLVNGEKIEDNTASVTVGNRDLDIRAVFKKIPVGYTLDVSYDKDKGSVVLSPEPEDGVYEEGTEVTVTAVPAEDYVFSHYESSDYLTTRRSPIEYTTNPLTIVMDGNYYLSAVFEEREYGVTASVRSLDADGNELGYTLGSVSTSPSGYYYDNKYHKGDKVTFTASVSYYHDESAEFKYFLVDGEQHAENPFVYTFGDHNAEVVAVFQQKRKVNVTKTAYTLLNDGTYAEELLHRIDLDSGSDYYFEGDELKIAAIPGSETVEFEYFIINGKKYYDNPTSVIVGREDIDVQAFFGFKTFPGNLNIRTYRYINKNEFLEDNSVGSYVKSPDMDKYRYGDEVKIKAVPAEGYELDHISTYYSYDTYALSWEESDEVTVGFYAYSTGRETYFNYDVDVSLYFVPKKMSIPVRMAMQNEDGSLIEGDKYGNCYILYKGTYYGTDWKFSPGDEVTVSVYASGGYRFSYLLVDGERVEESSLALTLGATPPDITAVFVETGYSVNVRTYYNGSENPNVGRVIVEPLKDSYKYGDNITVRVETAEGYDFDYMYIGGKYFNPWSLPVTWTVSEDVEIEAYFRDVPEIMLWPDVIELDGEYTFSLAMEEAATIRFSCGDNVQTLPIAGQGDQYVVFRKGSKVDVEVIPNPGYEFVYACRYKDEEGGRIADLKFTIDFDGYDYEGFWYTFCFREKDKVRAHTHSTGVNRFGSWDNPVVPGEVRCNRQPGEPLNVGDRLTFTAVPANEFSFNRFNVTVSYRGHTLTSYQSTSNPLEITVGEQDYEINVTAAFDCDMPKLIVPNDDYFRLHGDSMVGLVTLTPEPVATDVYNQNGYYGECAYYPTGTDVTLTITPWNNENNILDYMRVDDTVTYELTVSLKMDGDHIITPVYNWDSKDTSFNYTQYHAERGVIDFYDKVSDHTIDCFVNNRYFATIAGTDSICIDRHPAFEPGKPHFVRFRDPARYFNECGYVMTAPKVSYKPYVVSLGGVGSGQIDIYEIVVEADPASRIEYEVYDVKNYTTRWYSPEEYKALFALLGVDRVAVLPEMLGYRLTGIRAVADHPAEWGRTLESSTVSVPTYDYIRTGLTELTAEDLVGAEVYDLNGRRIHSTDSLAPGIYILRRGSAVRKVLVR